MDPYSETFSTWNKLAEIYQAKFMDLDIYNETYDFICNAIAKRNAKILDLSCGPGNITRYLLSKRPDFDIHGIDIAPNMIAIAQQLNPAAHFTVMDIRNMDIFQSKYEGIVCGFGLPYLSEKESDKLIEDCNNLLNANGWIYLSFVDGDPSISHYQTNKSGDRVYFNYHREDHLMSKLKECLFDGIKSFKVEYNNSGNKIETHTVLIGQRLQ